MKRKKKKEKRKKKNGPTIVRELVVTDTLSSWTKFGIIIKFVNIANYAEYVKEGE